MSESDSDATETARLEALTHLAILESEGDPAFDSLTQHLASVLGTSRAAISLVDQDREWFKSNIGSTACEGPRDDSFCSHTIQQTDCLVVEDATTDDRFKDFVQVTEGGIRFYAGAPIRTGEGHAIGALCVRDIVPRSFGKEPQETLLALAQVVAYMIEARQKALAMEEALRARMEAERKALAERDTVVRLAVAVQHSQEAVVIFDRGGMVEYVNPAFCELTGYSPEDAKGEHHSAARMGVDPETEHEEVRQSFVLGRPWAGTIQARRLNGELYTAETNISPIRNKDGRVAGFVEVRRDITERERLQAQLTATQRLESIGQLAAGIAHEINTPIQFVSDNTRFLKDGFQDLKTILEQLNRRTSGGIPGEELERIFREGDAEYLAEEIPRAIDQTLEGIARVSTIVQAMKAFSHPSSEKSLADLGELITNTVTVAKSAWKQFAELEIDVDPNLPLVPCIAGEFNQVILNLVVNASHAIEDRFQGTATMGLIQIKAHPVDEWAEIVITDNGGGMPPHVAEKAFDPFFTTKGVGKGTGQGLFLAHEMVSEKHGGTIEVDSTPGEGTTFTIRLPLVASAVAGEV